MEHSDHNLAVALRQARAQLQAEMAGKLAIVQAKAHEEQGAAQRALTMRLSKAFQQSILSLADAGGPEVEATVQRALVLHNHHKEALAEIEELKHTILVGRALHTLRAARAIRTANLAVRRADATLRGMARTWNARVPMAAQRLHLARLVHAARQQAAAAEAKAESLQRRLEVAQTARRDLSVWRTAAEARLATLEEETAAQRGEFMGAAEARAVNRRLVTTEARAAELATVSRAVLRTAMQVEAGRSGVVSKLKRALTAERSLKTRAMQRAAIMAAEAAQAQQDADLARADAERKGEAAASTHRLMAVLESIEHTVRVCGVAAIWHSDSQTRCLL